MTKLAIAFVIAATSFAAADKKSEAKLAAFRAADAAGDEGCDTIPITYSAEHRKCEAQLGNVHLWCDGRRGPVTCGNAADTTKLKLAFENAANPAARAAAEAALVARRDQVDNAIRTIETCLDHRETAMNIFGDALDKMKKEKAPELKALATSLMRKYKAAKSGHAKQIRDKNIARDHCRDWRPIW
jgi:hypothetical protein